MKRTALVLAAAAALLAGCGGDDESTTEQTTSSGRSTSTAPSSTPSSSAARPPTASPAATTTATLSLETEQAIVTSATADLFARSADVFSDELVKSSPLVEAQTDFRFDRESRTVVLAVTSVFKTGNPQMPYQLATNFAPVFWGPEGTGAVSEEALPLFSVTVDDASFVCDPVTMVALAEKELSEEGFVERCAQ